MLFEAHAVPDRFGEPLGSPQSRTSQCIATEVGGQQRGVNISGTIEQNGWLSASIEGPGVACRNKVRLLSLLLLSDLSSSIIRAYRSGHSLRQIGSRIGLSPTGVRNILVRAGEPRRPKGACPKQRTRAEVAKAKAVCAAYRAGRSMRGISHDLGICTTAVWNILVREGEPRRSHSPRSTAGAATRREIKR
jgi:hypothetical protein